MPNLEKRTILVLSSCHVTEATGTFLDTQEPRHWPCVGGPYVDYGWFVYAHEENPHGEIPEDLFKVMQFARSNGCENILFDRDAEAVEALPHFEW